MDKQTSLNPGGDKAGEPNKFISVTRHLKDKDFKWLKDDMGFFEFPESWDAHSGNDNGDFG